MRKLTLLLFALLLVTVGAWAQSVDLQASTSTDAPEHMYLLANGNGILMDSGTGHVTGNEKPGRFAFFPVAGKPDTYKMMSVDASGDKWVACNDISDDAANKITFTSSIDNALEWKITASDIKGTTPGYQLQPYKDGSAFAAYMNWNGGANSGTTSAGFWRQGAASDAGSGWKLIISPKSGTKYYLQDHLDVYLNIDRNSGTQAIVTSEPNSYTIEVQSNGYWLISNEAGNYLCVGGKAASIGASSYNWNPVLVTEGTEVYYALRQNAGGYDDNTAAFVGNNSHKDNTVLWANAPGKQALRLRLTDGNITYRNVTINVKNSEDSGIQYTTTAYMPEGENTLADYLPDFSFVTYASTKGNVDASHTTFELGYTVDEANNNFPFFTSYEELTQEDKQDNWVSFFTLNGRMHVYDPEAKLEGAEGGRTKRNSTIDRATFTRLNDNFFWGFVREGLFKPTYIVNKGAKESDGSYDKCLYLTFSTKDSPVLMGQKDGVGVTTAWITREWIIEKSSNPAIPEGETHYGIRANRTDLYINNYQSKGYMSTHTDGPTKDKGSDLKFTPELETYNIMKGRALNAPCNAVHSLNPEARLAIQQNKDNTVAGYKKVIDDINNGDTETGFIQFTDGGYYVLRNYTPAGENEKVYSLGSDNGETVKGFEVPEKYVGSNDKVMQVSNVNTIWKVSTNPNGPAPVEGTYINTSKTIARFVEHVNSGKKLSSEGTGALNSISLTEGTGTNYYFVNLGAGQHFIKSVQFTATGKQAQSMPISVKVDKLPIGTVQKNSDGTAIVERRAHWTDHYKNSRDTWYGIKVSSIEVEIGESGYATIYLPFGVTMPKGLTAYAVTSTDNGVATLTGGNCIPANQGAILKGNPGSYTLTINDGINNDNEVLAVWNQNKLNGSCMATDVSVEGYVLSKPAGKEVGLYKAEMSGTWKNNANKAYLPASEVTEASGNSRFLSFNFDTVTGLDVISGTESGSAESVVYDLSGRRVRTSQKGLYIVNGKKVVK